MLTWDPTSRNCGWLQRQRRRRRSSERSTNCAMSWTRNAWNWTLSNDGYPAFSTTGTTTVEKLEGTLGRGGIPTPFLFRLPPFPCYSVVAAPVFPFHSLLFSLTRPLNPVGRSGDVLKAPTVPSKITVSCKSWRGGDQIHLVPKISKVGGDASHGYHRVVNALWFSTYPLLLTFNFVLRSVKWTPLLICIAFVVYVWLLKIENCHYGFLF